MVRCIPAGSVCWQAAAAAVNCGELMLTGELPAGGLACPGLGKLGTPWLRMHWEYFSSAGSACAWACASCCTSCSSCPSDGPPGSRCRQSPYAFCTWLLLMLTDPPAPTSDPCAVREKLPDALGSGEFGTPWVRMHPTRAISWA